MSAIATIKHKIAIMSAKGGVGKTALAIALAQALTRTKTVGLLDLDLDDPDVLTMMGIKGGMGFITDAKGIQPLETNNMKIISMEQLPFSERALLLDGNTLGNIAKEFMALSPKWGLLDHLVIDSSPGTSSVPQSIVKELHNRKDGVVIVTTSRKVDLLGAKRCIDMVKDFRKKVLGVVLTMSTIQCGHCNEVTRIGASSAEVVDYLGQNILLELPYVNDTSTLWERVEFVKIISKLGRF